MPPSEVAVGEILLGPVQDVEPELEVAPRRRFARRAGAAAGLVAAAALVTIMAVPEVREQIATSLALPPPVAPPQSESIAASSPPRRLGIGPGCGDLGRVAGPQLTGPPLTPRPPRIVLSLPQGRSVQNAKRNRFVD